jgi:hypothetical protein
MKATRDEIVRKTSIQRMKIWTSGDLENMGVRCVHMPKNPAVGVFGAQKIAVPAICREYKNLSASAHIASWLYELGRIRYHELI